MSTVLAALERAYLFVRNREWAAVVGVVVSVLDVVTTELQGSEFHWRSLVPVAVALAVRWGVFSKARRDDDVVETYVHRQLPEDIDWRNLKD